jgi:hypothetical protein
MPRFHSTTQGDIPFTAQEEAEWDVIESKIVIDNEARAALSTAKESKTTGVLILGVMCSATGKDQAGMLAVDRLKQKYDAAGAPMPSTKFDFKNGNSLTITNENFASVDAAWTAFRASFFTVS